MDSKDKTILLDLGYLTIAVPMLDSNISTEEFKVALEEINNELKSPGFYDKATLVDDQLTYNLELSLNGIHMMCHLFIKEVEDNINITRSVMGWAFFNLK